MLLVFTPFGIVGLFKQSYNTIIIKITLIRKDSKMEETKVEEKKVKIGLATHAFNFVDYKIAFNQEHAIATWAKKYDMVMIGKKGLDNATAREKICEMAIENGCTHILFLDQDHVVPVQMLDLLLENKDTAMVSGLVCKKGEGFKQVAFGMDSEGRYLELNLPLDGRIYEVAVCAFGCTIVNVEKLQKLEKPWFRDTCEEFFGKKENCRSDVNLCNMFRKQLKEKIFIDTRILIGHLGVEFCNVVYPQNAEFIRNMVELYNQSIKLKEGQQGFYGTTI